VAADFDVGILQGGEGEARVARFWKTSHIFFSRSKVAFAKRKNSCTEEWARAKTGGHAYRRGTVLVPGRRDDLGGWFGGLVGGGAAKPRPSHETEARRIAHPEIPMSAST
jgi:hypothetical protein